MDVTQATRHLAARFHVLPDNPREYRSIKNEVNAAIADLCRTIGATVMTVSLTDATGKSQQVNAKATAGKPAEHNNWRQIIDAFLPGLAATYGLKRVQVSVAFATNNWTGKRTWPHDN